jgi:uncharacterized protein YndB with AHSA1/START domain
VRSVPQSYAVSARSAAPPERVFAILADGARWSEWAGPVIRRSWWDREGDPAPGGVGALRRLGTRQFASCEEIVAYDPPTHLAYTIVSGQPVRGYRADVRLSPDGSGTRIDWSGTFEPLIPGTGAALRWWFTQLVGGFARRLAERAERSD